MSTDFEIENEDGKVTLTEYTGKETNVIIPDRIEVIGNTAFFGNDTLISVKIPGCVKRINGSSWGNGAFKNCENLRSVTFSEGIEEIGAQAFSECSSLPCIEIPSSVREIGSEAFSGCSKLRLVTLEDPFYAPGHEELTQLEQGSMDEAIPELEIGDFAFTGCEKLEKFIISQNLKSIGKLAVPAHTQIRLNVQYGSHLSQNIPQIGFMYLYLHNSSGRLVGVLYIPGYQADDPYMKFLAHFSEDQINHLSQYDNLFTQSEAVILHKCRAAIARLQYPLELDDKYRNQYSSYLIKNAHLVIPQLLASEDIPALSILSLIGAIPLDRIDDYLEETKELSNIEIRAILMDSKNRYGSQKDPYVLESEDTPGSMDEWEYDENMDGTLTITRYRGCETDVVIPSGIDGKKVSKIEGSLGSLKVSVFFPNMKLIQAVAIEDGIVSIGERAFMECRNLRSVSIPESVREIGKEGFSDCSLLELILLDNISVIGDHAFMGIKELGIRYQKPPQGIDRFGAEKILLNLTDEDQKTIAKLYFPSSELWSKTNPYTEFTRLVSEGEAIDLPKYDDLFLSQGVDIFDNCYIALTRLMYPCQLLEKKRKIYIEYLMEDKHLFIPTLIRRGKLEAIGGLAELDLICLQYLELYIDLARDFSKKEIVEVLLRYQEKVRNSEEPEEQGYPTVSSPDEWVVDEDCIRDYKGNRLIVIFPSEIGGQNIRRIESDYCFFGGHSSHVLSVMIEEGIEVIGAVSEENVHGSNDSIFRNCVNLKHVYLPSSIKRIHMDAFWGYKNIIIHAPKGSFAIKYAKQWGIKYVEV